MATSRFHLKRKADDAVLSDRKAAGRCRDGPDLTDAAFLILRQCIIEQYVLVTSDKILGGNLQTSDCRWLLTKISPLMEFRVSRDASHQLMFLAESLSISFLCQESTDGLVNPFA